MVSQYLLICKIIFLYIPNLVVERFPVGEFRGDGYFSRCRIVPIDIRGDSHSSTCLIGYDDFSSEWSFTIGCLNIGTQCCKSRRSCTVVPPAVIWEYLKTGKWACPIVIIPSCCSAQKPEPLLHIECVSSWGYDVWRGSISYTRWIIFECVPTVFAVTRIAEPIGVADVCYSFDSFSGKINRLNSHFCILGETNSLWEDFKQREQDGWENNQHHHDLKKGWSCIIQPSRYHSVVEEEFYHLLWL